MAGLGRAKGWVDGGWEVWGELRRGLWERLGERLRALGKVGGWFEGGCGVWGKLRSEFGGMAGLGRTREWVGGVRLS